MLASMLGALLNRLRTLVAASVTLAGVSVVTAAVPAGTAQADVTTPIAAFPYEQDWSDASMITTNDDWSGVVGFQGYLGDDESGTVTNVDPRTLLADNSGTTNVFANALATASNGGVLEVGGSDPTIAFQGSGAADAPNLVMRLDLTDQDSTLVSYNLRDLDASADNAAQQVALHYRIGATGPYTDIPEAYVADATDASSATRVTPVTVQLPSATAGEGEVYVRWMTTNAANNDELVGIDDIVVRGPLPPAITPGSPASGEVGFGSEVTLDVELDAGDGPFTYEWYLGESGVTTNPVGTDPTFTTAPLASTESYWVRVENESGSDDSETATLTVVPAVPLAIDPATPASGDADGGEAVTLEVDVTDGTGPITYQWFQGPTGTDTTPVGTNSPSFTTPALTRTTSYWVRVTNSVSTVDSATATVTLPCQDPLEPISGVQGSGATSDCVGAEVTIEGIVVGDYEGPCVGTGSNEVCALRGFYVQSRVADDDGDPATSEGIFVFNGDTTSVAVGDAVRVTGVVAEFQGQTQINTPSSLSVLAPEAAIVPTEVSLPMASATDFERFEGMLVTFPQELTVTETFHMGRSGEVRVSSGGRLLQPTAVVEPGEDAVDLQAENLLNYFIIDDAANTQNPDPYVYAAGGGNMAAINPLRGGDTTTGATGVMTYTWAGFTATGNANAFRLRPQSPSAEHVAAIPFVEENPRPAGPPTVDDDGTPTLKIAGFNVLNYFRTLDIGTQANCGVIGARQECRGANTDEEFTRQHDKLIAALLDIDADVYGFAELENTEVTPDVAVDVLGPILDSLNAATSGAPWAAVDTGLLGTDTIRVGMIYRTDEVEVEGWATMTAATFPGFDDDNNRPTLAVSISEIATGEVMTVAVNHWKSKGSCPGSGANADQGDGASCWNAARVNAAESLLEWLGTNPTELPVADPDVLVFGDLNSYANEDPIDVLTGAGYVDVVQEFSPGAYSYVFDGQWGTLDYALASPSLAAQVTGAADYHINADEVPVLDYNTDFKTVNNQAVLYAADRFRTSDHDPAVVGLALDSEAPTPTITYTGADPTNADTLEFTVTFDEPVFGFDDAEADLVITGDDVDSVADPVGTGAGPYAVTVTVEDGADGALSVQVPAGAVQDDLGFDNVASLVVTVDVDQVAPTPVVIYTGPDPTNAGSVAFEVDFGEDVTGFIASDLLATGISGATPSIITVTPVDGVYDVSVAVPAGSLGELSLRVRVGEVTDLAGNPNAISETETVAVDRIVPTATLTYDGVDPTNAELVPFSVEFSESVTGLVVGDGDITFNGVGGVSVGSITGGGTDWTVRLSVPVAADGELSVHVNADAAHDDAGNGNTVTNTVVVDVDRLAPAVAITPVVGSIVVGADAVFEVVFSEAVNGVLDVDDLEITGTSATPIITGSGSVYAVTFENVTEPGTISLHVLAAAVSDAAGNPSAEYAFDAAVTVTPEAGDAPDVVTPTEPSRYWDSREGAVTFDGQHQGTGFLGAEQTYRVQIGGRGDVPADATGVVANLTAIQPDGPGFATLYPCTAEVPKASHANYLTGEIVANNVVVPLDDSGGVCVFTKAGADFALDVNSFVGADSPLVGIDPTRYLDTRTDGSAVTFDGVAQATGTVPAEGVAQVTIGGRGLVPADATAVFVNVTAVAPQANGYLRLFPCGALPGTSTLNYATGQTVPNGALALLSPTGDLCIMTKAASEIIVDVMAYLPAGAEGLTAITPERFLDTRPGQPPLVDGSPTGVPDRLAADEVIEVQVAGVGSVPTGASAVLFNVTAVAPDGPGYVTLFPCTGEVPTASNVNFTVPGSVRANNAITQLSASGKVCVYAKIGTDVILDVMGFAD